MNRLTSFRRTAQLANQQRSRCVGKAAGGPTNTTSISALRRIRRCWLPTPARLRAAPRAGNHCLIPVPLTMVMSKDSRCRLRFSPAPLISGALSAKRWRTSAPLDRPGALQRRARANSNANSDADTGRRSRRITRAFHQVLRLSIVPVLSGRVLLTERSCATVQAQVAPVLKFFTAITSCMCSAPTHNGIGGPVGGYRGTC